MGAKERSSLAVTSLDVFSAAKVFAFYYSFWGLITALVFVFTDWEGWKVPLGFLVPFLSAKLDFTFRRSESAIGLAVQIGLITLAYALTGWLSGLVGGAVYNLISRHFGLQLRGRMETPSLPESQQRTS